MKVVLQNNATSDVDMKKKDLIIMLLSIMQVNFLYDRDRIFNENSMYLTVEKNSVALNQHKKKKKSLKTHGIRNPEQWIVELKTEKPWLMSKEWYDNLLVDLHCFDQYIENFDELRFSTIEDICIYVNL